MQRFWFVLLLLFPVYAQQATPQQTFEQLEAQVQDALNRVQDTNVQLNQDIKALEVEVEHFPPLLEQMNKQLQSLQNNYARVRAKTPQPLSCVSRNDIAYSINGDLSYQVVGDLNYSLTQDIGYAQTSAKAAQKRLETSLTQASLLLVQLRNLTNQLRQASRAYPAGSERYARLLVKVINVTPKTQQQIRDTEHRSQELMTNSQLFGQGAVRVYQQGQQILAEAKVWLDGLTCQS